MNKKILMIIVEHKDENALKDLVENVRFFCPEVLLALYNSGEAVDLGKNLNLIHFPSPRKLDYAKVTPFFFSVFEWLMKEKIDFDYFMNLETDMLFIRKGFESFISNTMKDVDYMGPRFKRYTSKRSKWRPIRSLRPELKKWYHLLGFNYTNEAFSPGQLFSKRYIENLVIDHAYADIKQLIDENASFSLQEILLPTLSDFLSLNAVSYPEVQNNANRYRPYMAVTGVKKALSFQDAYFVHPVKRSMDNPARLFIRSLVE